MNRPQSPPGRRHLLRRHRLSAPLALLAIAAAGVPIQPAGAQAGAPELEIDTLSSRPDMVTGGTALVEVRATPEIPLDQVRVRLNGVDVTDDFVPDPAAHTLTGPIGELSDGSNQVTASIGGNGRTTDLEVTSHPITGPLFAGPHQEPFVCDTAQFETVVGDTLGPPLDEHCSAETRVDYVYRNTGGEFVPLPAGTTRPADLEWTTISTGAEVPYVVRVETGTINRGIYESAILHDPQTDEPDPWHRPEGWNDRLFYKFGGGCNTGWYVQGRATADVLDHGMLENGYAVASSSLNVFGNNCNDLLASETVAMVKEHFVETYGPPLLTLGWGSSGGSYQSHQTIDNYPGVLDGAIVNASFPDVGFGTAHTISDAGLLLNYFTETDPDRFTREQQRRIAGFGEWEGLTLPIARIDPTTDCKSWVPQELLYDPETNPDGARCDLYAATANAYGTKPDSGAPRRPLDNVGVQYGLEALESGDISVEDFLDLNERIGGYDDNAAFIPERTGADLEGTAAAYRSGRLLNGGAGLAEAPIVDIRTYTDDSPGDIHMRFQGFATRERMLTQNGTFDNHVMLVRDGGGFNSTDWLVGPAIAELDAWVTGIVTDTGTDEPIDKIRRHRPEWLEDSCWTPDRSERIIKTQLPNVGGSACAELYPVWPSPRMVAGGPLANDIVKCQLQPFDPADYGVEFSAEQAERAADAVFPDGVCDWARPGVEQQPLAGTWQRF